MKKLNTKGFAHHMALVAVVVVAAIGGIGSYIYLNSSSAATLPVKSVALDIADWTKKGGAVATTDQSRSVMKFKPVGNPYVATSWPTVNAKVKKFITANFGKAAQACVTGRAATTAGANTETKNLISLEIDYMTNSGFPNNTKSKNFRLTTLYKTYCYDFTVVARSKYSATAGAGVRVYGMNDTAFRQGAVFIDKVVLRLK